MTLTFVWSETFKYWCCGLVGVINGKNREEAVNARSTGGHTQPILVFIPVDFWVKSEDGLLMTYEDI